jgi:hypothetical protein
MAAQDRSNGSNGSNGERFPSPETLAALHAALTAFLGDHGSEAEVCTVLGTLATEARDRRLHAEHMLVAFKQVWNDMPEVRAIPSAAERQRRLARLVKLCIDIYYQG